MEEEILTTEEEELEKHESEVELLFKQNVLSKWLFDIKVQMQDALEENVEFNKSFNTWEKEFETSYKDYLGMDNDLADQLRSTIEEYSSLIKRIEKQRAEKNQFKLERYLSLLK